MREHTKVERINAFGTGGGPAREKPKDMKIEPTASIMAVFKCFGHLMTGLPACDSDRRKRKSPQNDDDDSHKKRKQKKQPCETMTSGAFAALAAATINDGESANEIHSQPTIASQTPNDAIELQPTFDAIDDATNESQSIAVAQQRLELIRSSVATIDTETVSDVFPPTTPHQRVRQFFPTTDQRRRKTITNNSNSNGNSDYWEKRSQLIHDEAARAAVVHQMRIAAHEQQMRHREAIFNRQMMYWGAAIARRQRTTHNNELIVEPIKIVTTTNAVATETATATADRQIATINPHNWNYKATSPHDSDDVNLADADVEYLDQYLDHSLDHSSTDKDYSDTDPNYDPNDE